MKLIVFLCIVLAFTYYDHQAPKKTEILSSNPDLIGQWSGDCSFMNETLDEQFGFFPIVMNIKSDHSITVEIGEAQTENIEIKEAEYGFTISGDIDGEIDKRNPLSRKHFLLLLVLPDEQNSDVNRSEANLHLKKGNRFDFGMIVCGMTLLKSN